VAITSKEKAVGIIHASAVAYGTNLSGRNVLFVAGGSDKPDCYEMLFLPQNFLHLTGMRTSLNSEAFYRTALNKGLSPSSIEYDPGGTSEIKLEILPRIMTIHKTARMIGLYDNSRPLLVADRFAGTVTMAMGFICIDGLYRPNTALKIDVRDITEKATRQAIAAIFVKLRGDSLYSQLTYIAKGMTINDEVFAPVLREKVDMQNLTGIPTPQKIDCFCV